MHSLVLCGTVRSMKGSNTHRKGCSCLFCNRTGRSNHKSDCQCVVHGGPPLNQRPLAEILVRNGKVRKSSQIKNRLIREGLLSEECETCWLTPEWNGKPLVLQIDHCNGDNKDWRLENLRILCPNCHSQTETFAGRNKGRHKPR